MKTKEEWYSWNPCTNTNHLNQHGKCREAVTSWIEQIQQDAKASALLWVAKQMCTRCREGRRVTASMIDPSSWGHANAWGSIGECPASFIHRALAKPVKEEPK